MKKVKVEQIESNLKCVHDYDTPVSSRKKKFEILKSTLGDSVAEHDVLGKIVPVFKNGNKKPIILLTKAITYLGLPHPIFKKRIQIPLWFKEYSLCVLSAGMYDVKYLGIYYYHDLVVFVDFDKTKYLQGKSHNSSAHVCTNDLLQALNYNIFPKIDVNGNKITCITRNSLGDYLSSTDHEIKNPILNVLRSLNKCFPFNAWITAEKAIKEMYENHWPEWRQAEWAGWFLEYFYSSYITNNALQNIITYTGLSNKSRKNGNFDFDLFFPEGKFYGDLKASDIHQTETLANDQDSVDQCIKSYGKFWYIIYEHDTIKDKEKTGHPMTNFRTEFISKIDGKPEKIGSYLNRMKHSIRFMHMMVIEINRFNSQILRDFNQGHQPNGQNRKPKYKIKKSDIDNFVIYRYQPT